jgi:glycosyltransferase involved in cell wall biosynthesis
MASGLPILFIGRGDGAEIIAKAAAGLVVIPKDLTELHKAVKFMLKNPDKLREFSNNGISCARANFSRDMIADRFETIIKHLTPR